ncbi:TPA: hypothetical protein JLV17_004196 [Escherichia coli]|nr:hypothetical protein [Escherichia coli]
MKDLLERSKLPWIFISLYMVPVFLFGKNHRDDYARLVHNYYGWASEGRPLTELIIRALSFGGDVTSISPLSQILAIFFGGLSCSIVSKYVIKSKGTLASLGMMLIFTCPFFIQNILYKFDVLTMMLSILLCTLPFIFLEKYNYKILFISSLISGFLVLCTYQPTITLLFALCFVVSLHKCRDAKKLFGIITGGAVSLVAYKLFIATAISGTYAATNSSVIDILAPDAASHLKRNFYDLYFYLSMVTDAVWFKCNILIILISASAILYNIFKGNIRVSIMLLSFISMLFSFFMFFILNRPIYSPRVFVGFSSILACIAIAPIILCKGRYIKSLMGLSIFIPIILNFSIMSSFLTSLESQYKSDTAILYSLFEDNKSLDSDKPIYIHGTSKRTSILEKSVKKYPIIGQLVYQDMGWWMVDSFAEYEHPGINLRTINNLPKGEAKVMKKWNGMYQIINIDNKNIVVFKR